MRRAEDGQSSLVSGSLLQHRSAPQFIYVYEYRILLRLFSTALACWGTATRVLSRYRARHIALPGAYLRTFFATVSSVGCVSWPTPARWAAGNTIISTSKKHWIYFFNCTLYLVEKSTKVPPTCQCLAGSSKKVEHLSQVDWLKKYDTLSKVEGI
jgi:hypothetical protein